MIINKTFLAACELAVEGNIRPTLANIEVDKNLTTRATNSFFAGRFTNKFEKLLKEDYPEMGIKPLEIEEKFLLPVKDLRKIRFQKNKSIAILNNTKFLGQIKKAEYSLARNNNFSFKIQFCSTDLENEIIETVRVAENRSYPNIDEFIEEPKNGNSTKINIELLEKSLKALKEHGARSVKLFVSDNPLEPFLLKGKDYRDYGEYTDEEPESDIIIMPLKE